MHAVSPEELHALLAKAGIEMASPTTRIGAQLTYRPYARRTVVVQFGDRDTPEYVTQTVQLQSWPPWRVHTESLHFDSMPPNAKFWKGFCAPNRRTLVQL